MSQLSVVLEAGPADADLVARVAAALAKGEAEGLPVLRYVESNVVEAGAVAHIWQGIEASQSLKVIADDAMNGCYALASGGKARTMLSRLCREIGCRQGAGLVATIRAGMELHPDALLLLAFDPSANANAKTRAFLYDVLTCDVDDLVASAISTVALMKDDYFRAQIAAIRAASTNAAVANSADYALSVIR